MPQAELSEQRKLALAALDRADAAELEIEEVHHTPSTAASPPTRARAHATPRGALACELEVSPLLLHR